MVDGACNLVSLMMLSSVFFLFQCSTFFSGLNFTKSYALIGSITAQLDMELLLCGENLFCIVFSFFSYSV